MKELMMNKYLGFIGVLTSLILSITLYAYKSDQTEIENNIIKETIERKNADTQIRYEFKQEMINHEKLHLEQKETNDLLIKYLDQRFDDMEKLINSK